MSIIGDLLRRRRIASGLTLSAVSARCGIGVGRLCEFERGIRVPTVETIGKLATGYEVERDVLVSIRFCVAVDRKLSLFSGEIARVRAALGSHVGKMACRDERVGRQA